MQREDSAKGHLDEGLAPAGPAAVDGLAQPHVAEERVIAGAGPLQAGAGAVVADPGARLTRLQCCQRVLRLVRAAYVLRKAGLQLGLLRLRIAATAFKCRVLGLQEPDVLAKDRRTAALVDQLLQKFKWSHGLPVGLMTAAERRGVCDAA